MNKYIPGYEVRNYIPLPKSERLQLENYRKSGMIRHRFELYDGRYRYMYNLQDCIEAGKIKVLNRKLKK